MMHSHKRTSLEPWQRLHCDCRPLSWLPPYILTVMIGLMTVLLSSTLSVSSHVFLRRYCTTSWSWDKCLVRSYLLVQKDMGRGSVFCIRLLITNCFFAKLYVMCRCTCTHSSFDLGTKLITPEWSIGQC